MSGNDQEYCLNGQRGSRRAGVRLASSIRTAIFPATILGGFGTSAPDMLENFFQDLLLARLLVVVGCILNIKLKDVLDMKLENIILQKQDRIATITLDRPQAINSLSLSMLCDLEMALQDTEEDNDIDVIVLTASGERGFCAGMDLKDFEQGNLDLGFTRKVLDRLENFSKPTIAAITDGYCITGGLEFALSCDILVASDKAVFGDTHSRVNISGGGAAVRMPRLIGLMKAKHMIFTSQFFDALAAKDMGLLIEVYPSQRLQEEARKMALEILKQDQVLVRRMKQLMNRGWRTDLYAASALEETECLRGMEMKLAQGFNMNEAVKKTRSDRT